MTKDYKTKTKTKKQAYQSFLLPYSAVATSQFCYTSRDKSKSLQANSSAGRNACTSTNPNHHVLLVARRREKQVYPS